MGIAPLRLGTTQHARPPAHSKKGARPAVMIGGKSRSIPLLSGPVGPESLRSQIPGINALADTALVDGCFEALVELQPAAVATPTAGAPHLAEVIRAVQNYKTDRAGAIAAFQRIEDIRDDAERRDGVIQPNGLTWETLFTYGELARDLDDVRDRKVKPADYIHIGFFDEQVFQDEATKRFKASKVDHGRFNSGSIPAMLDLLGRCARDPRILDIRWIAYILATAMWETSHGVDVPNAGGKAIKGKTTHRESRWALPVEEGGKGRLNAKNIKDYYLPVKVAATPDGATVTEQDGDTFNVSTAGAITRRSAGATHGSNAFAAATATYAQATGTELRYYGRGFCQLTWWDNYASTGAEIGLGLELLFHPERALEPEIAFEVMVHAMVYGQGFANGRRLQMYLTGGTTNYKGARAMVNGTNENVAIAAVAEVFEKCLLAARK